MVASTHPPTEIRTYHGNETSIYILNIYLFLTVARERRRDDRPPSMGMDIYMVNMGRQGILCLLSMKNGVGVAT